jgi:hypothetical protein
MSPRPAPQPLALPADPPAGRRRRAGLIRCLAVRVGRAVRAAHAASVPF